MKLHPHRSAVLSPTAGFTLVELMVATGLAVVLIGVIIPLAIFTSRSFFMMGNYVDLDAQSRYAVDLLGREIRNSNLLLKFSTNTPMYLELTNNTTLKIVYVSYYTNNGTLMMTNIQSGVTQTKMLLTNCDNWIFSLYNRAPTITSTNITFNLATNASGQLVATNCKVINMSWKCSRTLLGTKINTESVQTAQIILRNKVQ